jgi:hypothetical protein
MQSSRPVLFIPFLISFSSLNHAVELNKQISCTLQLTNKTDKQVAFKVKRILSCAFPGRRSQPRETKWYRTRSGLSLCDTARL